MPMTDGIPAEEVITRLERLRALARERGLAGILAIARPFFERPANVAYLSNHFPPFTTGMFWGEARGLGHAALVIPLQGEPILFYDTSVRRDLVPLTDLRLARNFVAAITGALREKGLQASRVGLLGDDLMPVAMYREITQALPGLTLEPADDLLTLTRLIKSPREQELLRKAASICDTGYAAAFAAVRDGATEREVCAAGIAGTIAAGADFVRYLRTHSGPYSAWGIRWPQAMDRVMRDGDMIALDLIGAYWGQQFDVLRSSVVGRKATDAQKRQLETALAATRAALDAARPGATPDDLVRSANAVIEERGYGQYARPFIGHGIGYETVEPPLLVKGDGTPLQPGMVLCIEPGINIPDVGGACIEEEIIVTKGAPEVISRFEPRQWE
jgi:Xaa-Pro aminopeptidase